MNTIALLRSEAKRLRAAGWAMIPVSMPLKNPATSSWKDYQNELPTDEQHDAMFAGTFDGIALICRKCECVDFDLKYDRTGRLYSDVIEVVRTAMPEILSRVIIEKTITNGYHWWYKCPSSGRNTKGIAHNDIGKCVIEIRGEGGYAVIAPTQGYELLQGDFAAMPTLTSEERDELVELLRSFNNTPMKEAPVPRAEFVNGTAQHLRAGDDYNTRCTDDEVMALLERHGARRVFSHSGAAYIRRPGKERGTSARYNYQGDGKLRVYSSNYTPFAMDTTYSKFAIYTMLEHNGDYKAAAKKLYDDGYGEKTPMRRAVVTANGKVKNEIINTDTGEVTETPEMVFWFDGDKDKLGIDDMKLLLLLEAEGFAKFYPDADEKEAIFIRIQDNIVSETTPGHIQDFIRTFIEQQPEWITPAHSRDDLLLWYAKSGNKWFRPEQLMKLRTARPEFHADTATESFLYFRNCYVGITATQCLAYEYYELKQFKVWASSIKPRDFRYDFIGKINSSGGFYERFIANITGKNPGRMREFMTAIGFLLHRYKRDSYARAIVLADENLNENPQGRTGKGLALKALDFYRNVTDENGKSFDLRNPFCYQKITPSTEIFRLNDASKWLDIEGLFSVITEGFSVEKKHQTSFTIPFAKSPKICISTNYTVNATGDSARGRIAEYTLVKHYSAAFTPEDEFGGLLFSNDWSAEEWFKTDMFIIGCLTALLLNNGRMLTAPNEVLEQKRLVQFTSEGFVEWADGYFANEGNFGTFVAKDALFAAFLSSSETHKAEYERGKLKPNTFTKWVEQYCELGSISIERQKVKFSGIAKNSVCFTRKQPK